MRYWRKLGPFKIDEHECCMLGPAQYARPGMLTYAVSEKWIPHGSGAVVLYTGFARGKMVVRDDPEAAFWEIQDSFPEIPPDHPNAVPPFKIVNGRPVKALGGVDVGEGGSVAPSATIQQGMFGENTELGPRVHLDSHVHIGHGAVVGESSVITAGAIIGGWAQVGKGCQVNLGAVLAPWVKIGDNCVVGANSIVLSSMPDNTVLAGSPARRLRDAV
jgi:UDP-3-O-[3-hydroxymyristoyl] glucosamine N-acyltransferase